MLFFLTFSDGGANAGRLRVGLRGKFSFLAMRAAHKAFHCVWKKASFRKHMNIFSQTLRRKKGATTRRFLNTIILLAQGGTTNDACMV